MPDGSIPNGPMADLSVGEGALGLLAPRRRPRRRGGEGDFRSLVLTALAGWRVVLSGGVLGVLLALVALWMMPAEYTATMVVGPTARTGAAAMGMRVPVVPGRQSSVAVAEPGAGDETLSDYARYLELFGAYPVAERLMADPALLRGLFPSRWDAEAGRWRAPPGVLPALKRLLLASVGRQDWVEPDAQRVAATLRDRLVIDMVRSGPMRRISLRHRDRAVALELLGRIAAATDAHLRAEAARRSAAQIGHVKERLAGRPTAEHLKLLAELLSDQERVAMMIEVDLPFAADQIEPAVAATLPDWPNPAAVVPLSGLAGLILGCFALSVRAAWRRSGTGGGSGEEER